MSKRKNRTSSRRSKIKGFKIHVANYVGVIGFLWLIYLVTTPGFYPWPIWPTMGWGLGLFFHFVGAVLAPRWGDEADEEAEYQPTEERIEEKFSSEYRMDDAPSQMRRRASQESWDGVDVQVHDVDDRD